jgi:hypothetical protein
MAHANAKNVSITEHANGARGVPVVNIALFDLLDLPGMQGFASHPGSRRDHPAPAGSRSEIES